MREFFLKLVTSDWKHLNGAILLLRLFAGIMMFTHGWAKWTSFSALEEHFPDPLGVGHTFSLILILFAEIVCSFLLILGLLTRLATLPLIFGMLMVFLVIHGADPFPAKELSFLYLGMFIILLWSGGGKYSLDEKIRNNLLHQGKNRPTKHFE